MSDENPNYVRDMGYQGGVRIVKLETETYDAKNVRGVRAQIEPYLREDGFKEDGLGLIVDLSAVTFVDSSGLGGLLSLLRSLKDEGKALKLAGLTRPVRILIELVRLHRIMECYKTVDEAVSSFQGDS